MAHLHCENGVCRMVEDEEDIWNFPELTSFLTSLDITPIRRRFFLLQALAFAQEQYGRIDFHMQAQIAATLCIPQSEIAGIIRFYKSKFHGTGYLIKLCCGDHCFAKNSGALSARLQTILGAFRPGEETNRSNGIGFVVVFSDCLGACANAPVIDINGHIYSDPSEQELRGLLRDIIM